MQAIHKYIYFTYFFYIYFLVLKKIVLFFLILFNHPPVKSKYLIIGAGVHGLSTAWHLAEKLKNKNGGIKEDDVLVLDKTGIAAGASGTACGVVRNNYFQPAMRELMAHSVEVWESDPKTFAYDSVGFMAISPESMKKDMQSVYQQQKAI